MLARGSARVLIFWQMRMFCCRLLNFIDMPSTEEEEKRRFDLIARLKPREKNEKKFTCINPEKNNISEFPALKDCLPDSYEYHVCDYKTISETGDHVNFRATLRMVLSTVDEIKLWLKSHAVTWRVDRTDPGKGQKVIFKVDYRCQHKTRPRGIEKVPCRRKNTNCPAKMTVTLLRTIVSRGRQSLSTDPHVPTFPTIITMCSEHNHNIYVTDALRISNMEDSMKGKHTNLLEAGHSPSSALDVLKYELKVEDGNDYVFYMADRELCPTLMNCYRLPSTNFQPQTAEMRANLLYIETGNDNVPLQFLEPLREEVVPSSGTDVGANLEIADGTWHEETDVVMIAEEVQQTESEEVAHRAAAAEFAEMCQELSTIISSDSSFTAASVAAVNAFKKIKDCPSKIMAALHMFGSYTNTSLASLRSRAIQRAARHSSVARRRIRLGERRPLVGHNKFTTRRDHVYCQ